MGSRSSRRSDDGTYMRKPNQSPTTKRPERHRNLSGGNFNRDSVQSEMSIHSDPDRYSYRKSSASMYSMQGANRRSQSESLTPFHDFDSSKSGCDELRDYNRSSFRDSGIGRISQRFSMEETRKKISALESIQPNSNSASKSSTPYSSPAATPILERANIEEESANELESSGRFIRNRDSAYASGRFIRKVSGVGITNISEGDEEKEEKSRPVFLSDVLDTPSFMHPSRKLSPGVNPYRKASLPAKMVSEIDRNMNLNRLASQKERVAQSMPDSTIQWEDAYWPNWDPSLHPTEAPETSL